MGKKGSGFERDIAKQLTVWLTGVEKPYKYWRMPASGGLATIHEECAELSGDIRAIAPDAEFLTDCFSIECKTGYPSTSFWQHFKQTKGFKIKAFWTQCCGDATKSGKRPMLIYRKKGNKPIVGIDSVDGYRLMKIVELKELPWLSIGFPGDELPGLSMTDFNGFFELVTPDIVKKFIEVENGKG